MRGVYQYASYLRDTYPVRDASRLSAAVDPLYTRARPREYQTTAVPSRTLALLRIIITLKKISISP